MKTHDFTIIASGLDPHTSSYEDRLYEAGCDDATLSFQKGLVIAEFAREAATLSRAILSAIENMKAGGAVIERIEPDYLVSLSDIAERCALSKQAISIPEIVLVCRSPCIGKRCPRVHIITTVVRMPKSVGLLTRTTASGYGAKPGHFRSE